MSTAISIIEELEKIKDPVRARILARFFKTGKGEYGEGDEFIGLTVPQVRAVAKKNRKLPFKELIKLLKSSEHEARLTALVIMVERFKKAPENERKELCEAYLAHTRWVNNWDLVDTSAEHIVGGFLMDKPKKILTELARSKNVWERRIAIMATFHFIKRGESEETLRIAKLLLNDRHDLIHKAVGWMLREVGKRCARSVEEEFLRTYYKTMPRTMLRYAIEHFPAAHRKAYLHGVL